MRKFILIAVALCVCQLFAAMDTYTTTAQKIVFAGYSITNYSVLHTQTNAVVDTSAYKGFGTLCVTIGDDAAGWTGRVAIVTIQQTNTTSGGWSTIGAATNKTGSASLDRIPFECGKGGKYLRGIFSQTNGNASASAILNAYE